MRERERESRRSRRRARLERGVRKEWKNAPAFLAFSLSSRRDGPEPSTPFPTPAAVFHEIFTPRHHAAHLHPLHTTPDMF